MIDMHHDLLSIMYYSYIRNDYRYLENWLKNFREDNVSGLIANLYFMSRDAMKEEMGNQEIDVLEMFRISTQMFQKYLPNTKVIYSIEGADYIENESMLEELYRLGLRNILLVWNNPNQYGSGNESDFGLTEEGKNFLRKAIELGISIDLSHMNKKTFYDTISLIKEEQQRGKDVKVIASHSNSYELCHHPRNLDDDQIKALGSVHGILGIVGYDKFVKDSTSSKVDLKQQYLKQIDKAVSLLGIDHVGVATDDMIFDIELFGHYPGEMVFQYENVQKELRELLSQKYHSEEIDKILYKNIEKKIFKEERK